MANPATVGDIPAELAEVSTTEIDVVMPAGSSRWVTRGILPVLMVTTAEFPIAMSWTGSAWRLEYANPVAAPLQFTLAPKSDAVRSPWGQFIAPFDITIPNAPTAPAPTWIDWTVALGPTANDVTITPATPMPGIQIVGAVGIEDIQLVESATSLAVVAGEIVATFAGMPSTAEDIKFGEASGFLWEDTNLMLMTGTRQIP